MTTNASRRGGRTLENRQNTPQVGQAVSQQRGDLVYSFDLHSRSPTAYQGTSPEFCLAVPLGK